MRLSYSLLLAVCFGSLLSFIPLGERAAAQPAPSVWPVAKSPSARCGFLLSCTRFDAIGLHVGLGGALRLDGERSYVDALGALRLSLTR